MYLGLHDVLWQILYQLLVPFMLWKKAIVRLAIQRRDKSLSITKSTSKCSLFSYYLKYLFEFIFDASIFLSYLLAPLYAFTMFVIMLAGSESFGAAAITFVVSLIISYFSPLMITLQHWSRYPITATASPTADASQPTSEI